MYVGTYVPKWINTSVLFEWIITSACQPPSLINHSMSGFCPVLSAWSIIAPKSVALASQTAILYNTFRAAQKQARYQYSGEFTSVFQ